MSKFTNTNKWTYITPEDVVEHRIFFLSALSRGLNPPSADPDSHASPHHEDSTSGAESCHHTRPARLRLATTPRYYRYGNHSYHQTWLSEHPHQPAGGQQANQSELGACAAGIQERHGGKTLQFLSRHVSSPPSNLNYWTVLWL